MKRALRDMSSSAWSRRRPRGVKAQGLKESAMTTRDTTNGRSGGWRCLAPASLFLAIGLPAACNGPVQEPPASEAQSASSTIYIEPNSARPYRLFAPSWWVDEKLPLVFVLHGFGNASLNPGFGYDSGLEAKGEAEGFFVVSLLGTQCVDSPTGDPHCTGTERGWNNGISPSLGIVADDVQYVRDVLEDITDNLDVKVDKKRVYAAGYSNGAMMTHRLAAEMPDVLAAVGVVAGTIGLSYSCDPFCDAAANTECACSWVPPNSDCETYRIPDATKPISIAIIHGTDDDHVQANGSVTICTPGLDPMTLKEAVDFWAEANGCGDKPHLSTDASGTVHRLRFTGCKGHTEVVRFLVDGLAHAWPPTEGPGGGTVVAFSATDVLWQFFARHHR
jgi:polyhydroxybutyrate depolymerase